MDNNQNQPNTTDQPQNPVAGSGTPTPESTAPSAPTTTPTIPTAAPAAAYNSESSAPNSETPVTPSDPKGGKKPLGLMIGALLVLLLVFIGLIYYFVLRNPSETQQPVQQLPVQDLPQESVQEVATPTPELTEETVESIDIGSPEADLSPIQADLNEL